MASESSAHDADPIMSYWHTGDIAPDHAIRCRHCNHTYVAPTRAKWLAPEPPELPDGNNSYAIACVFLACELCEKVTGLYVQFHKGTSFIRTERMDHA